jgi:hypothetical protein
VGNKLNFGIAGSEKPKALKRAKPLRGQEKFNLFSTFPYHLGSDRHRLLWLSLPKTEDQFQVIIFNNRLKPELILSVLNTDANLLAFNLYF